MDPLEQTIRQGLKSHFGFAAFRGRQFDVIRHVLEGGSGLAIFPTGEGKSLCYQLPALLLDGLTVVLSPLIALMQDQVAALQARDIPADFINSSIPRRDREARLERAIQGKLKLLYVTPERFRNEAFRAGIDRVKVSLLAVDESHCISQWGHDFRPDYLKVGEIRARLGDPPVLGLTATATPEVQRDILERLRVPDGRIFHTGIERENLFLGVKEVFSDEEKVDHIVARSREIGGPGIVYLALIRDLLELETELRRRGFHPLIYHGDLSASERRDMLRRFMDMDDALILATNAFGMGVDKPDIRFILHHQVPGTLEAYYQEVGRAGRDGKGSLCELLFFSEDVLIQKEFTEWANPGRAFMRSMLDVLDRNRERLAILDVQDIRETLLVKNRRDGRVETCLNLLETAGCTRGVPGSGTFELVRVPGDEEIAVWLDDGKRERDLNRLLKVAGYAGAEGCRKAVIHEHFGLEVMPGGCGACDRCVDEARWLAERLPPADRRPIQPAFRDEGARISRGDWIDIVRHGPGLVTRVEHHGRRVRIQVELSNTLRKRHFDLDRIRWRKL
jgi:ATP-dependent DNA helicase RecQ